LPRRPSQYFCMPRLRGTEFGRRATGRALHQSPAQGNLYFSVFFSFRKVIPFCPTLLPCVSKRLTKQKQLLPQSVVVDNAGTLHCRQDHLARVMASVERIRRADRYGLSTLPDPPPQTAQRNPVILSNERNETWLMQSNSKDYVRRARTRSLTQRGYVLKDTPACKKGTTRCPVVPSFECCE